MGLLDTARSWLVNCPDSVYSFWINLLCCALHQCFLLCSFLCWMTLNCFFPYMIAYGMHFALLKITMATNIGERINFSRIQAVCRLNIFRVEALYENALLNFSLKLLWNNFCLGNLAIWKQFLTVKVYL